MNLEDQVKRAIKSLEELPKDATRKAIVMTCVNTPVSATRGVMAGEVQFLAEDGVPYAQLVAMVMTLVGTISSETGATIATIMDDVSQGLDNQGFSAGDRGTIH